MIRAFQIASLIFAGISAYFIWMENKDGVFVALVLAASSFFLSMRFQAKARLAASEIREDILPKNESNG